MARPQIRLKGFNDEWNESSFDCLFSVVNDSKSNVPKSEYQQIGTYPVVDQSKKYIVGYTDGNNPIIPQKSLIIFGDHTREIKYIDFPFYTGADGTKVLKCKNQDSMFLYYLVSSLHIPNTGYNRHFKYLRETVFAIPESSTEQEEIAKYFRSLDALIQAAAKKIDSLKQMKAACLQSMFPQLGETAPKVRFKGFIGDWVQAKLGTIFKERNEYDVNAEMLSVTLNQGVIKASENGRFDNSNNDKSHYRLVKIGDIAYNSMRMWQGASGCSQYEGIVSPAYTVVAPTEGIFSQFFAYLFKTKEMIKTFRLHSQGLTSDTWNLKYPAFSKISVYYPDSFAEQKQIASFFSELDAQIRLHEQKLAKLKQIKASCLDKMFV